METLRVAENGEDPVRGGPTITLVGPANAGRRPVFAQHRDERKLLPGGTGMPATTWEGGVKPLTEAKPVPKHKERAAFPVTESRDSVDQRFTPLRWGLCL